MISEGMLVMRLRDGEQQTTRGCRVGRYQYEGQGCGPYPACRLPGPGKQVGPRLLQAVGDLSPARAQTRDELAQQQPQQLQGGVENLRRRETESEKANV